MILDEINKMMHRNIAGESALKFFKDVVHVKSTNLITSSKWRNVEAGQIMECYKKRNPEFVVSQVFEDAARTGLGNCSQKAAICFSSLVANPRIFNNSFITICLLKNENHAVVLVTETNVINQYFFHLSDLSRTTMIVDGWTEDYYFPNLSAFERDRFNLGATPNPVQLFVRCKAKRSLLQRVDVDILPDSFGLLTS